MLGSLVGGGLYTLHEKLGRRATGIKSDMLRLCLLKIQELLLLMVGPLSLKHTLSGLKVSLYGCIFREMKLSLANCFRLSC